MQSCSCRVYTIVGTILASEARERERKREREMVVPVVDVGALVRELGKAGDCPSSIHELSKEAQEAVDTLHHVCSGGSGGLVAVNHGFDNEIEAALNTAMEFHALSDVEKEKASRLNIFDSVGSVKIAVRPASLHEVVVLLLRKECAVYYQHHLSHEICQIL